MRPWTATLCLALGCSTSVTITYNMDATVDAREAETADAIDRLTPPDADADAAEDATCTDVPVTYHWPVELRFTPGDLTANCFLSRPRVESCSVRVRFNDEAARDVGCVAHGRSAVPDTTVECDVAPAATDSNGAPLSGAEGFFFQRTTEPRCIYRLSLTGGVPARAARIILQCVTNVPDPAPPPLCNPQPLGAACTVTRPSGCELGPAGCPNDPLITFKDHTNECASGLCAAYTVPGASPTIGSRGACTCLCGVALDNVGTPPPRALCPCPAGFICVASGNPYPLGNFRGSYCVRPERL